MLTGSKYLNLAQIAAGAMVLTDHSCMFFPQWRDTNREIEIRINKRTGFASFYDNLGLLINLADITDTEVTHMHNYIHLSLAINNRLRLN